MSDTYEVILDGGGPWGIRLQGGKDFGVQLNVARVCMYLFLRYTIMSMTFPIIYTYIKNIRVVRVSLHGIIKNII